jgi:hypothetical protein
MPARAITIAEDETWLGPMPLVAIEAVSGFILLGQFAKDRSAGTWSAALEHALVGLNVTVAQGTSDEAKGLLAHVQRDLGAHHSPDLLHLQHEVAKGTGRSLARVVEHAKAQEVAADVSWQDARGCAGLPSAAPRSQSSAGARPAHRSGAERARAGAHGPRAGPGAPAGGQGAERCTR